MIVFLKRIPTGTRKSDIQDFIADTVKGGFFSRAGQIKNIAIIERPNPHHNMMDSHGIVSIEPDNVAERVIKKLNRTKFKGKPIEVRRYFIRNAANDPRKKTVLLMKCMIVAVKANVVKANVVKQQRDKILRSVLVRQKIFTGKVKFFCYAKPIFSCLA